MVFTIFTGTISLSVAQSAQVSGRERMSLHSTLSGLILCPDKLAHQFVDAP